MATSIGSLNVILGANAKPLAAGLAKAQKMIGGFAGAATKLSGVVSGVASAAAVVGTTALVKSQMAAIDSTAKLADRIGISTEALAGFRYAADLSGAGADVMDKALVKMARGVAEATYGTGEAKVAIDALGLSADRLAGMTPDQQMRTFADSLSRVENANQRVYLATKLFGEEGTVLINTLSQGSGVLDEATARMRAYGVAVSRIDAAQVEMANDAIADAGRLVQGLGAALAVQLSPVLQYAAEQFVAFGTSGDGATSLVTAGIQKAVTAIAYVHRGIEFAVLGFEGLQLVAGTAFDALTWYMYQYSQGVAAVADALPFISKGIKKATADARDSLQGLVRSNDQQREETIARLGAEWERLTTTSPAEGVERAFAEINEKARLAAERIANAAASQAALAFRVPELEQAAAGAKSIADPDAGRDANSLIRANSAEGQALAFASRTVNRERDRVQKDHLNETKAVRQSIEGMRQDFRNLAVLEQSIL